MSETQIIKKNKVQSDKQTQKNNSMQGKSTTSNSKTTRETQKTQKNTKSKNAKQAVLDKYNEATQKKLSEEEEISAAKEIWHNEKIELDKKKASIGYEKYSMDQFVEIDVSQIQDELKEEVKDLIEKYRELQEEYTKIWAEDLVVEEMNKKHAIVRLDKTRILSEITTPEGHRDFITENTQSLREYYTNDTIELPSGKTKSKVDVWLKSPHRKEYQGIVFDPNNKNTKNKNGDKYYNIWKGFAVEPREPNKGEDSCALFWKFVKEVICSNKPKLYTYVRKWIAYVFQNPDELHTALVLMGGQGVGKNTFVETLGYLLGQHFIQLSETKGLITNFNYHLKDKVLVFVNESWWGGLKKDEGSLKAKITDPYTLIEQKGKDQITIKNNMHFIIGSNESYPVHLDSDDRRFVITQVSDKYKKNTEYFEKIRNSLKNGGYECLLKCILAENLEGYNPREIPNTEDAFELKLISGDNEGGVERFVYEMLEEGSFFNSGYLNKSESPLELETYGYEKDQWHTDLPRDMVYKSYKTWCEFKNMKCLKQSMFGKKLSKILPSTSSKRLSKTITIAEIKKKQNTEYEEEKRRLWCYEFGSLDETRSDYCNALKVKQSDIFDNL